jgi:6-phosphogluconate dehydrogenase
MIGLGVVGRNLVLNMADHGFSVAGYDKDPNQVRALQKESTDRDTCGVENTNDFIALLRPPRAVMILVPAGAPATWRQKAFNSSAWACRVAKKARVTDRARRFGSAIDGSQT